MLSSGVVHGGVELHALYDGDASCWRAGIALPCPALHLLLDLEFHKPSNPGLDGAALTAQLVTLLCDELALLTGEDAAQVTELDSTTTGRPGTDKYSRHASIRASTT